MRNYKNTSSFVKAVKAARKYERSHEKLVIIAGACQSYYEELIKAGANFASSQKRVNIHDLDPAIIASTVALTEKNKEIDLIEPLEKTKYGKDGLSGLYTSGLMYVGYPRENKNAQSLCKNVIKNIKMHIILEIQCIFVYFREFLYNEDIMDLEEKMFLYSLSKLNDKYGNLIKEYFNTTLIVPTTSFPRIKLSELYKVLEEKYNYFVPDADKCDLSTEAEKLAYKYAMDEFNSEFIFVTDFDKDSRAFYHHREDDVPQGYDLIWKGVEITTGAQREHNYYVLCKQAKEKGLDKDVESYLEFFKYGCPPHGGFGLGVDRITMLLLNLSSLKESMLIYRGPNRLKP